MKNGIEQRLWEWHRTHYGPTVSLSRTYRKLLEEVGELGEALMEGSPGDALTEAGDVATLLLMVVVGLNGEGLESVMAIAEKKLAFRDGQKRLHDPAEKEKWKCRKCGRVCEQWQLYRGIGALTCSDSECGGDCDPFRQVM
jgi:NTP pyrophosphatase (non-canonical NTP hydrolase)